MKKAVLVLLVASGLFWVAADPDGLARSARTAGASGADLATGFVGSAVTYLRELE